MIKANESEGDMESDEDEQIKADESLARQIENDLEDDFDDTWSPFSLPVSLSSNKLNSSSTSSATSVNTNTATSANSSTAIGSSSNNTASSASTSTAYSANTLTASGVNTSTASSANTLTASGVNTSTASSANTLTASGVNINTASTVNTPTASRSSNTNNSSISHPIINDYKDIVKKLASTVTNSQQFFLVIRRATPFPRILSLWRRQSLKCKPTNVVRVHYSGEDGIDSGAIALEFFEHCMQEMKMVIFPDGSPVNSSNYVQNGYFRSCGEIVAASLAQGGPPPCFLEPCCYKAIFEEIDMMCICDENLTTAEKALISEVETDCTNYTELIIENNYTGIIDEKHIVDIIGSLKVSFVTRRSLYMKEFMIGLSSFGLDELIKKHPKECRPLFVYVELEHITPDADYLFSITNPIYSKVGSSKRLVEEKLMDYLQDTMIAFEEGNLTGSKTVVAWNDKRGDDDMDESDEEDCQGVQQQDKDEVFETPCISIPKLMGWLTGLQHKPISGEKLIIKVHFDHDCLERNPKHTVCFPLVSACGQRMTLPVAHMQNEKEFKELFVLAFCKGQSFGKP